MKEGLSQHTLVLARVSEIEKSRPTQPADDWCMNQEEWKNFLNTFDNAEELKQCIELNGLMKDGFAQKKLQQLKEKEVSY